MSDRTIWTIAIIAAAVILTLPGCGVVRDLPRYW
jgi:hypothetical protein